MKLLQEKFKTYPKVVASNKRYLFAPILSLVIVTILTLKFSNVVLAAFASWGDTSLIHACVGSNGGVTIVGAGGSCGQNETQATWLKDVDAGSGLSLSRSGSGATLSLDSSRFQAYQVNPTSGQTSTSTSYSDMSGGTQQITLAQRSIVQVNAHANAYLDPSAIAFSIDDFTTNANDLTNNNSVAEESISLPFYESSSATDFETSSNQYLSISDASQTGLDLDGDHTIEFWISFESTPASGVLWPIASKWQTTGNNQAYQVGLYNDSGTLRLQTNANDGTVQDVVRWAWTPTTGVWYHVAVTFDVSQTTASEWEFFLNGSSQGNGSVIVDNNVSSIQNSGADFIIGGNQNGAPYVDVKLDEVRVWNGVRTSTEINDNKSVELTGSESNLVAYYPFEVLGDNIGYLRTTYDSGGSDTEIGQQGYTGTTEDGQSISAGGVVVLDSGTYTIAVQKKVGVSSGIATYNNPGMSIVISPTQ